MNRIYPVNYINHDTMVGPPTFTNYYIGQNPIPVKFPYNLYNKEFTKEQVREHNIGLHRYINSREYDWNDNLNNSPVFNSNMSPLKQNYMKY